MFNTCPCSIFPKKKIWFAVYVCKLHICLHPNKGLFLCGNIYVSLSIDILWAKIDFLILVQNDSVCSAVKFEQIQKGRILGKGHKKYFAFIFFYSKRKV